MPAGDAQRAWFPEMHAELEQFWDPEISWKLMIRFCQQMTEFRVQIKKSKGIKPVKFSCPACGGKHTMSLPPISIRSALFALRKLELVSDAEFKEHNRSWARFRKDNDLDAYGVSNQIDIGTPASSNCNTR